MNLHASVYMQSSVSGPKVPKIARSPGFLSFFLLFLETKVEKKWCTMAKCIIEGELWAQEYKMQTLVHLNSKLGW